MLILSLCPTAKTLWFVQKRHGIRIPPKSTRVKVQSLGAHFHCDESGFSPRENRPVPDSWIVSSLFRTSQSKPPWQSRAGHFWDKFYSHLLGRKQLGQTCISYLHTNPYESSLIFIVVEDKMLMSSTQESGDSPTRNRNGQPTPRIGEAAETPGCLVNVP